MLPTVVNVCVFFVVWVLILIVFKSYFYHVCLKLLAAFVAFVGAERQDTDCVNK